MQFPPLFGAPSVHIRTSPAPAADDSDDDIRRGGVRLVRHPDGLPVSGGPQREGLPDGETGPASGLHQRTKTGKRAVSISDLV